LPQLNNGLAGFVGTDNTSELVGHAMDDKKPDQVENRN
jgi:hypothetical protein